MNYKLIRITKDITFEDLKSGKISSIDVYKQQISSWLFNSLEQLSLDKKSNFENGYSMLALELLFFEPHGKYLSGNTIIGSRKCFDLGFNNFLNYLENHFLIDQDVLNNIQAKNLYGISRCGIFHDMTIKSGLLIDSIHIKKEKVFYSNPVNTTDVLVSPWNFYIALKKYFNVYIEELKNDKSSVQYINFEKTFKSLFKY